MGKQGTAERSGHVAAAPPGPGENPETWSQPRRPGLSPPTRRLPFRGGPPTSPLPQPPPALCQWRVDNPLGPTVFAGALGLCGRWDVFLLLRISSRVCSPRRPISPPSRSGRPLSPWTRHSDSGTRGSCPRLRTPRLPPGPAVVTAVPLLTPSALRHPSAWRGLGPAHSWTNQARDGCRGSGGQPGQVPSGGASFGAARVRVPPCPVSVVLQDVTASQAKRRAKRAPCGGPVTSSPGSAGTAFRLWADLRKTAVVA